MPVPLSLDIRHRIASAYAAGEGSMAALARRFAVSRPSVERILARLKRDATLAPRRAAPHPPQMPTDDHALFAAWLHGDPALTQAELARRYGEHTGRAISRRTAGRTLARMGYTYKKSR